VFSANHSFDWAGPAVGSWVWAMSNAPSTYAVATRGAPMDRSELDGASAENKEPDGPGCGASADGPRTKPKPTTTATATAEIPTTSGRFPVTIRTLREVSAGDAVGRE